jgi:hypothetical protein
MQPNSFIIANKLRLFCRTVRLVAKRINDLEESLLYEDYTGLPIDIKDNPFNNEVEKYERSKNFKNKIPDFKMKYSNAILSQYMYRQIVLNGASTTFKNYDCQEDNAYDAAITDEVLYRSYRQMLIDKNNKPETNQHHNFILKQESELEKFPELHRIACEWINMYFYPATEKQKEIITNMRSNIRFVDNYLGHHNQTVTTAKVVKDTSINYAYQAGSELFERKLSLNASHFSRAVPTNP